MPRAIGENNQRRIIRSWCQWDESEDSHFTAEPLDKANVPSASTLASSGYDHEALPRHQLPNAVCSHVGGFRVSIF